MRTFNGPRLRDERRLVGLSAAQLAARINRSEWTVWGYETGRAQPPLAVADALAATLGLPLERFLAGSTNPMAA